MDNKRQTGSNGPSEPDEHNINEKDQLEIQKIEKGKRLRSLNKELSTDLHNLAYLTDSDLTDRWSSPEPKDSSAQKGSPPSSIVTTDGSRPVGQVDMGSKEEPVGRSLSRQNTSYDEDEDVEELGLKDDQQKALFELQQFKLDLHKARYTDEEPPEYDVAERVRQLNQELANSPTPLDDERARSIKFKDNLVDLVAPPPDYPSEDEGAGPAAAATAATTPATPPASNNKQPDNNKSDVHNKDSSINELKLGNMNLNDNEEKAEDASKSQSVFHESNGVKPSESSGKASDQDKLPQEKPPAAPPPVQERSKQDDKDKDQVLVERDGKFELVNVEDLTAEERDLFLGPQEAEQPSSDTPDGSASTESTQNSASLHPTPPRHPRPSTASSAQSHRRAVTSAAYKRRAQSATPSRSTANHSSGKFNSDYQSPYAIPQHLKKIGEKRVKEQEERAKQEKELSKLEEDQKRRENEEAFQAWKNQKRKTTSEQDQKPKEDVQTHENDKKKSEAAFNEWMKAKRNQMRREKHESELLKKEEEQFMHDRPRQESDKAFRQYVFKEWLKKKNQETRKAKKQEVSRTRIRQLLVRRTRKAMQLARAIQKSQTFRYVDYYGYRF